MGRKSENPRYNVISARVSDLENIEIRKAVGKRSLSQFILTAIEEKLIRDRQARIDAILAR